MTIGMIGATALACCAMVAAPATGQTMAKAAVAEKIKRVENGVDEFRNYLERRGENARSTATAAQSSGRAARRGGGANPEAQKAAAQQGRDELNDALGDLNRSTNRLRRKFDGTDTWMETKGEVQRVVDDGRRINQAVARGGTTGVSWQGSGRRFETASTTWLGPMA
jgi:gas vesicle protein